MPAEPIQPPYPQPMSAELTIANVLAHCGGDRIGAARQLSRAIAATPHDPSVYEAVAALLPGLGELPDDDSGVAPVLAFGHFQEGRMDDAVLVLGALGGVSPRVSWADAPWFADERFLAEVGPEALCEAALRLFDHGAGPGPAAAQPWLRAVEVVTSRTDLGPEDLARMAIALRAFGLPEESLAMCDRADALGRTVLAEVVRAGTWRALGKPDEAIAAFDRALVLEPDNWSLHLDVSDLRALRGDHAGALASAEAGLRHAPDEPKLRAARAAYEVRLTRTPEAVVEFESLAGEVDPGYHSWLRHQAGGTG